MPRVSRSHPPATPSRTTRWRFRPSSAGKTPGPSTNLPVVTSPVPLAAVVLAGGASRRMGRDKATMPVDGSTMVELVVSALSARGSPVFVIAAPGQPLPELQAEVLRDEVRGVG